MGAVNYNKENYYTITLRVPKNKKELLQNLSATERRSITNLFVYALEKQYNVDLSNDK